MGAPPLTGLKEARLYLVRFRDMTDTLVLTIPLGDAFACQNVPFDLDVEPRVMGEVMITTVDYSGNESCIGSHVVFAVPAQEFFAGLWGEYYDNKDLSGFRFTRVDPRIDFNWGSGAPDPGMGADTFSIRWTGILRASVAGSYELCAEVNDGVRAWVNGVKVIDRWAWNENAESCASVTLAAGSENTLVMEQFEDTNTARAILRWTPPGGVKAVVPAEALSH